MLVGEHGVADQHELHTAGMQGPTAVHAAVACYMWQAKLLCGSTAQEMASLHLATTAMTLKGLPWMCMHMGCPHGGQEVAPVLPAA